METKEYLKKLNIVFAKLSKDFNQDFFRIVGQEFGYFDLPKKVSLKDVVGKKIFYRGVSDKIYLKELLADEYNDNFFIGTGKIGRGYYSSESKELVNLYFAKNDENVLKFYLKNCNMIGFFELLNFREYFLSRYYNWSLTEERKNYFNKILKNNERFRLLVEFIDKSKYQKDFINVLAENTSALASLLDYDAINNVGVNECLILNRSKIVVTDKEFRRVTGIETKRVKRTTSLSNLMVSQKGE